MGRKYSLAQTQGWEIPASESQPDVRHYMYLTPAGVALGDLVAIVAYMFAGGLILGVVVIMGLVALLEQEFSDSWRWAVAAGLVPPALVGLLFLRLIVALVNAALERILGVDLDDSGEVGDVPAVRVEVTDQAGRTMRFLNLNIDRSRLVTFVRLARAGRLTERDMVGVLSRQQWGELRQRLIDGGYVEWRNPDAPRSGLVVTAAGQELFDRLSQALLDI